ncbi:MAG: HlyD family efflux transporter periplasmic adaptor subunit [Roseococcus sp.]
MPDISPPGTARSDAFEQLSRSAGMTSFALPPAAPLPRRIHWLARRGRLFLALALVGAAVSALLQHHLTLATEHAVISALTLPVRAPIGGAVTDLAGEPGAELPHMLAFARVENAQADRGRLLDAIQERDRARNEVGALIGQISALEGLAADIRARGAAHREVSAQHAEAQLGEAQELRAAARARAVRAGQDAARALELARAGHGTPAARERAQAEMEAARREVEALDMRVLGLHRLAEGAHQGILTQPGQQGASYAEQRLDEIAIRRAELTRQASQQQSALTRAERRLAEEMEQHEARRSAVIAPPQGLILWRLHTQAGQRVLPEEVLAELVDCRSAFLLASVPQNALPSLSPGSPARLRLAGETRERVGVVVGRHGEGQTRESGNLAAQPSRQPGQSALVRIALPPFEPGMLCPVGRVGRVIFETRGFPWLW